LGLIIIVSEGHKNSNLGFIIDMKAWYLIHSKPRQEKLTEENLQRQGYSTYLPMTSVRRRKRGKTVSEVGPMFPRYLFIQLSEETDDWRPIRSTFGVSNLVRFGQIPARVPDELITTLKVREDDKGLCILPEREYQKGDNVRIAEGPFEGYEAIFQSKNAKDRVSLLVRVIEQSINISVDQGVIEPLS
jgi:transcriptional antiterminator RfaH